MPKLFQTLLDSDSVPRKIIRSFLTLYWFVMILYHDQMFYLWFELVMFGLGCTFVWDDWGPHNDAKR